MVVKRVDWRFWRWKTEIPWYWVQNSFGSLFTVGAVRKEDGSRDSHAPSRVCVVRGHVFVRCGPSRQRGTQGGKMGR